MKTYILSILLLLLFVATSSAQNNKWTTDPKSSNPVPAQDEVNISKHKDPDVIQSVGRTYNSREIVRMPVKDINSIVNTVPGVQARPGESPIIGGAVGGTAYYVDGVRVYGSVPLLTK